MTVSFPKEVDELHRRFLGWVSLTRLLTLSVLGASSVVNDMIFTHILWQWCSASPATLFSLPIGNLIVGII